MEVTRTKKKAVSVPTREKIKEAAGKVFLRKGFSATRTRDIAEESGINLALLNYYFHSKQKLFDEIMQEKIQKLLQTILPVFRDPATSLEEKIKLLAFNYIEFLLADSDIPVFVINELRKDNISLLSGIQVQTDILQSSFVQQLKERRSDINPIHFLLSVLGMTIFPFVAKPILTKTGMVNEKKFQALMKEREALIPVWMDAFLKAKL
jgi:AcrR family transcriptional regulator